MSWQPIETAPKDRPILIYTRGGEILIVTWYAGQWDDGEGRPWKDPAIHWMPLPEPPTHNEPRPGHHEEGEVVHQEGGVTWVCTRAGEPGTWESCNGEQP
jgi:hypothetical protein